MSGRALPPETTLGPDSPIAPDFGQQVRRAVIWRSGSQIAGQIVAWASTFLVIRILTPEDYGLFALTQVMLMLFTLLNGYGLASAAIQRVRGRRAGGTGGWVGSVSGVAASSGVSSGS